jgi:uncharacterized protein (DUF1800 family)
MLKVEQRDSCAGLERISRNKCRRIKAQQLQASWLADLAWGNDHSVGAQIQLWLGIFPVSWRQISDLSLISLQVESIRQNLSRGFTQLLSAMILDPALQISLNGPSNRRQNPNENFGRELLELFSLGEGNYTEQDVRETARALSGYRLTNQHELILDPRRHDTGPKTILGRTSAFDGVSLAEWLTEQPATARHITTRVWQRLVGTLPSNQRIEGIASDWRRAGLSIPWLMESIQSTPEAIKSRKFGLRLADPLEMIVRSLRLIGSRHPEAVSISLRGLAAMGQIPFEPPSVKGWPVNEQWIKLRWLQERRRTLMALIANEEVWATSRLPSVLPENLTPIPPLTLSLPVESTRENMALLFSDPVWQLA